MSYAPYYAIIILCAAVAIGAIDRASLRRRNGELRQKLADNRVGDHGVIIDETEYHVHLDTEGKPFMYIRRDVDEEQ
jgi:hypothetical protein